MKETPLIVEVRNLLELPQSWIRDRAAEDRYREALRYKDNDAVATIRLAVCLEKLGILDDARSEYESYLKILPHGPEAVEAQKAIDRLRAQTVRAKQPQ